MRGGRHVLVLPAPHGLASCVEPPSGGSSHLTLVLAKDLGLSQEQLVQDKQHPVPGGKHLSVGGDTSLQRGVVRRGTHCFRYPLFSSTPGPDTSS